MPPRPIDNPPNPWSSAHVEWLGEPPPATLRVFEERAVDILSENRSPDIPFRYSLNPYRGCQHACAYCYARPTHQYWDFGAGSDFDANIVVKTNAAEKLRERFERRSWQGDVVVFSGNTDCYQPLEASYGLTRACLEVCADYRNPVGIITKSALIRRDIDVLRRLADETALQVTISIPFADKGTARAIEPGAPSPSVRFETIRLLAEAGIEVGVAVAPVIPGLSDSQAVEVLERAAAAGATRAARILLRLPGPVEEVFLARIREKLPLRAAHVESAIRDVRGGALSQTAFGERMSGSGARWRAFEQLFDASARRLGLDTSVDVDPLSNLTVRSATFRRPTAQLDMFGD